MFFKNKIWLGCLFFLSIIITGCSSSSPSEVQSQKPSNLVVNVEVVGSDASNPNGDGSGKIKLDFSATNATSYKINFGNGDTMETAATSVSYTYTGSGTSTYSIYVSAYNADKFVSVTRSVTIYITPSLLWSDEFNTDGAPKSSNWGYDLGAGGWGNNEAEYYTSRADNVIVQGGYLQITAKKEDYQGAHYTSARLKTQDKFNFKYGKVEVRAKLPEGGGTWPAIWMLGSNINSVDWPACGEIDIMEEVGNNLGNIHSTLHTPSSYGASVNTATKMVPDASSQFHVYGMEWTPDKIAFSIDGTVFYTYNPATKNASTWPFDSNQFIILNVAMGGNFGGNIDPNFTSGTMLIDYVRVYQ